MRKENGYVKLILFVCMIIMYSQITGYVKAGQYVDPTVALIVSPEPTFKYGDEVTVEVQVNNADSYSKYGEGTFKATKRSYIIKGGATGVTWHYTYDSGYEATQGPEDFDLATTITREPIQIRLEIGDDVLWGTNEALVKFFVIREEVDPTVPYKIEWSGAKEGPVTVRPGESVTSTACLILDLPDYDGPGGECDSITFDYDERAAAEEHNSDEQDEADDIEDDRTDDQETGNDGYGW